MYCSTLTRGRQLIDAYPCSTTEKDHRLTAFVIFGRKEMRVFHIPTSPPDILYSEQKQSGFRFRLPLKQKDTLRR